MEVGFNISIHKYSEDYIKKTLSQYKEVDSMIVIEHPIIHMYAKKDTYDECGELNGYVDSLFCEYHFYDLTKLQLFKSRRFHDGLWFGEGVKPTNVRLFKDGSTLIQLRGKFGIMIGTSVHLELFQD
ncbi:hypothetical protein [Chengkuizengella marina]|uniref:Uncharacterized protein n=1 Tax=Chengkuizengella marina TaxID=2507566 RepID=A0A6N9Q860_9BACL|nr:hypothetical protein [Chengkuizengella marina]NBI30999.1 hypothetical protein [Chengkuizengella marina]